MNAQLADGLTERTQSAINELKAMIRRRYPPAAFAVTRGEDPDGIYLKVTVDVDDVDEVLDQVMLDRLFEIQVEQGLPLYLIPLQPTHRVLEILERKRQRPAAWQSPVLSSGVGAI